MSIEESKHYALAITCGAKRGPKDSDLTFSPASLQDFLKAMSEHETARPAPRRTSISQIKAELTITRPNNDNGSETIRISVKDVESRSRFLELEVDLADFAKALTGLAEVECSGVVRQLDVVGMRKITEKRSITYPHSWDYNRKELETWLKKNAKEPGWKVDPYLGAQDSVVSAGENKFTLNYRVYRYEPVEEIPQIAKQRT